ncbi:NAD(P)/FAD-dependent oxidoreductase [Acuticoccus mangrovi]|uniref:FAD-binding oxidoreductase n=1 Tax=Acuticoccus mangrovi TaxID=2796142 RepID=A0A934MI64_9HYPH|nr:FAD-binding oxidoreductase [Acuticoccus mangrovi]MBJ3778423.1 FAD-binding oxidoreductase [Acuticoccus mangrovi]
MASSAESFQTSLWWNSALEPPLDRASLDGEHRVDVAVVGAGYTGLSAALHLAQSGAKVAVLEARHTGFGASGRNGGQIIPGLKLNPDELVRRFGDERGGDLVDAVGGAADLVFDLVEAHGIRCRAERNGWVQAAHSDRALETVLARAEQWRARGVAVEIFDAAQVARALGTTVYRGGWRDPRAGTVQPLDLARGLGRAVLAAGGEIWEQSPVRSLTRAGEGWTLATDAGRVVANTVVIAANGYGDGLFGGLSRSVLPVQSMVVATEPLSEALRADVLPRRFCASETRKIAFYFRLDPEGRLVFGGRGPVGPEMSEGLQSALIKGLARVFPQLAQTPIAHRWSGQVALTLDDLPHVHELAPGLFAGLGYNGRGVAMATLVGRMLARRIADGVPTPLPASPLRPVFWHRWRRPVINAGVRWYWARDAAGFAA